MGYTVENSNIGVNDMKKTMIQLFEWYLPEDGGHWRRTAGAAQYLASLGITDVWLPPAYKGQSGIHDVGYGVYDLYDLGEFDQKGSIPTKYGTKDEYLAAIDALHEHGMRVIADVVLNHRMGADEREQVQVNKYANHDRLTTLVKGKRIRAWTKFKFPGRDGQYSDFRWKSRHFTAVDYDDKTGISAVYKFKGRQWAQKVDKEHGNYDYLMGADVNFADPEVRQELLNWGKWYFETAKLDGVRLDAVKHISYAFFPWWLKALREAVNQDFFAVGEYWKNDVQALHDYLMNTMGTMSLFDVSLHARFQQAGLEGASFDLRTILDDSLVSWEPDHAVTFVDNHDTQPGQALQSWVPAWFKPLAYALILLREEGTPCVFFGDLFGVPHDNIAPVRELEQLLRLRRDRAWGAQRDYFDFHNVIGWTREGGMAVVMSNGGDGWKTMKLGQPGQVFVDALGNRREEIVIGPEGWADFTVNGGSVSVWVPKE